MLLLADAKKCLNCTDSPWAHREIYMCLLLADAKKRLDCTKSPYRHTPKFIRIAARCKETSRLYQFTIGTPRNLHVLLLADAKKCLSCTDSPWAHREIYTCCCSPMQSSVSTGPIHHRHTAKFECVAARRCKEPSRLYGLTIGTPARQRLSKTRFPWVCRRQQQTATTSTGRSSKNTDMNTNITTSSNTDTNTNINTSINTNINTNTNAKY